MVKITKGNIGRVNYKTVVTIGMFDGVHLGHKSLLNRLVLKAKEEGGKSVAITFEPHPRILLSDGDTGLKFLTSFEEKVSLLAESGLDHLLVLRFDDEMSRMSTCDFVREILIDKLKLSHLVIGYDHHFGNRSSKTNLTIDECSAKYKFKVDRIEALSEDGALVSSTAIRSYLEEGNLDSANRLLGYDYILQGSVVSGKKIGRGMGFPTANIEPLYSFKLIPADGVYAVEVTTEGKVYKSMLYIGTRPTIETRGVRIIETNLFGFDGDLYGKEISISFKKRIRGDMKFETREQLREQIIKDKDTALRLLD